MKLRDAFIWRRTAFKNLNSGSIHYFPVWPEILGATAGEAEGSGLNTVETYIACE